MVVNVSPSSVVSTGLPRPGEGAKVPLPWSVGDTVALKVGAREGNDWLLLSPQGVVLRVPGVGALAELTPGALLLMRVLAMAPVLQLQRLPAEVPQVPGATDQNIHLLDELTAMREEPRLPGNARPTWDPPALAADWRTRLQLLLARGPSLAELPWAMRASLQAGEAAPLEPRMVQVWPWPLTCYAPGGWPLRLALRRRSARRRGGNAQTSDEELCLTLHLPTLGRLVLRIAQGPRGVDVRLEAEQPALAAWLAALEPSLSETFRRLGLRVCGWQVALLSAPAAHLGTPVPSLPALVLFQAAAEVLAQVAQLESVSPAPPRY